MRKFAFLAAMTISSGLVIVTPTFAQPQFQFGIGPDAELRLAFVILSRRKGAS